jgi:putative hydrolase of the HAD superfamily
MNEITLIFFDVGSVLLERKLDPLEVIAGHLRLEIADVRRAHRRLWGREDVNRWWSEMRTYAQQVEFAERTGEMMLRDLDGGASAEAVRFIERAWNRGEYVLQPDAREVLDYLSDKYRLGVLSNAMPSRRVHELADHDLLKYFDPVVISAELGMAKPERGIYDAALELAKASGPEVAFIDDKPENLQEAREAGFGRLILHDAEDVQEAGGFERTVRLRELMELF